jgi:hypothetical protein
MREVTDEGAGTFDQYIEVNMVLSCVFSSLSSHHLRTIARTGDTPHFRHMHVLIKFHSAHQPQL